MTKYGFIIDNRKCIGCHACTVACKQDRRWLEMTHPGPLENGLRRPEVFERPFWPDREMLFVESSQEV
jgi:Fe-S-cluster-containing dehydrogenase component